jgi:hypothetical protein
MMMFGICGMIGKLIVNLLLNATIDTNDWMVFAIWAVVAICGAIREAR